MKAKILVDGEAPKVPPKELERVLTEAGVGIGAQGADFALVVGGDGRFSRYGRTEDLPLLFVGVRSKGAAGSKAFLAQTTFNDLPASLEKIKKGAYAIDEHPRLAVQKNGRLIGEVFTDVYMQRGAESTCVRYRVKVQGDRENFEESAIGDGVVVSTRAGSTGYYSYLDRIRGDSVDTSAFARIGKGEVGVCHINPTYTDRAGSDRRPLRYTVPWGSRIGLSLFRRADARLYGTADSREGVKVMIEDEVTILPSRNTTKVITL